MVKAAGDEERPGRAECVPHPVPGERAPANGPSHHHCCRDGRWAGPHYGPATPREMVSRRTWLISKGGEVSRWDALGSAPHTATVVPPSESCLLPLQTPRDGEFTLLLLTGGSSI